MVACLVVLLKIASALCSAAVSGGASWAPSGRSTTSISGRASMIFVQSATSCLRLSCSSPVYGSTTWMPSPKLVNPTRPSSSTTSLAGSRPHRTTVEGAERTASSTRCAGRRTTFVSRSTSAPAAAKISRASSSSTKTPVRDSTSSVAPWISRSSSSVNTSSLKPPLLRAPARGFLLTSTSSPVCSRQTVARQPVRSRSPTVARPSRSDDRRPAQQRDTVSPAGGLLKASAATHARRPPTLAGADRIL